MTISEDEQLSSSVIDKSAFSFNVMGCITTQIQNTNTPSFPEYFEFQKPDTTEKCDVKFLYVLNENADNRETILFTLNKLYNDLGVHRRINYLVVVGDGKTYDHLIQLKNEEKEDLDWLLPYIGDWHALKNYQSILMKIYLDACLKEMIEILHRGVLFKVVSEAKAFDKTHNFLMQCWEAFYRFELQIFFIHHDQFQLSGCNFTFNDASNIISEYINLIQQKEIIFSDVKKKLERLECYVRELSSKFSSLFPSVCDANKTWSFWHNFIHVDVFIYIKYFLALRMGDWNLRNYCVKHISKLSQVSDSRFYSRLLPQNLVDITRFCNKGTERSRNLGIAVHRKSIRR